MSKRMALMMGSLHRFSAGIAALAAGGAIAAVVTAGPAPAQADAGLTVEAYTLPAGSYAAPLGSAELPMTPNPSGTGEWLIVSGSSGGTLLNEPLGGGTPEALTSGLNDGNGANPYLGLVSANGYWWTDADGGSFTGFTSSGTVPSTLPTALIAEFKFDARDLTADPSGNLYFPDHKNSSIVQALIDVNQLIKSTGNLWTVPKAFSSTEPEAVAVANGQLWFTTDSGQLGSFVTSNSNSTVQGPYAGVQANGNGHTLVTGSDGNLWAVGGGSNGSGGSQILKISPANGTVLATYTAGLPANPEISAITTGSDGNIWFTESGANEVGQLAIASGTITNFPLPAGAQLPGPGASDIAPGSNASDPVFFPTEIGGTPAVGVIGSSLAPPTTGTTSTPTTTTTGTTTTTTSTSTTTTSTSPTKAGSAKVAKTATVTAKGIARVKISCSKAGACSGKLVLEIVRKERVKVHKKTVAKTVTTSIGSAKYKLAAGKSKTVTIKLSHGGVTAVTAAAHHKLSVTARFEPAKGKAHSSKLSLTMQTSK